MATHLATAYPVARKEHRCDFCNGTIGKGEKYARHIFSSVEYKTSICIFTAMMR